MGLFLPHHGWLITFQNFEDDEEFRFSPFMQSLDKYNWNLFEDDGKAFLSDQFDPKTLAGNPQVKALREAWVYTTNDPVTFPEKPTGRTASTCGGTAVLYGDRDQAIKDLTLTTPELRGVWDLWQSGPAAARGLARAVLDGKTETLPVLADAVEEAGHPLAAMMRRLAEEQAAPPDGKAKAKPSTRGPEPSGLKERAKGQAAKGKRLEVPGCVLAMQEDGVVRSLAWTSNGKRLGLAVLQTAMRLRDAVSGEVVSQYPFSDLSSGAVSPDGKLFASGSVHEQVYLYEPVKNQWKLSRPSRQGSVYQVVFAPDGKQFATGYQQGTVDLWDVDQVTLLHRLYGHRGRVWALAFAPDGSLLASGGEDGTVRVWDLAAGGQRHLLPHCPGTHVAAVAFSPDGQLLASGGFDDTICLWESATGREVRRIKARKTCSLCFAPAGKKGKPAPLLASGDRSGSIHLWDAGTGQQRQSLMGHCGAVYGLAFAPRGRRLATGGADGVARVWDLELCEPTDNTIQARRASEG